MVARAKKHSGKPSKAKGSSKAKPAKKETAKAVQADDRMRKAKARLTAVPKKTASKDRKAAGKPAAIRKKVPTKTATKPAAPALRDPKAKASNSGKGGLKKPRDKEKEKLRKQQEAQKQAALKEKLRLQKERDKEKEKLRKQQEAQKQAALKEKLRLQKERDKEKEKLRKQQEAQKQAALKEKLRLQKEREDVNQKREADKQRRTAEREGEKQRKAQAQQLAKDQRAAQLEQKKAEKEAAREAGRRAKEDDKARKKAEKEVDRHRLKQEREAEKERQRVEREADRERKREEARVKKEQERSQQEAAREAFSKAKAAELARIRAEREAAKKALEGKLAQAANRSQRSGARSTTTRVYTPSSIPNQTGTARRSFEDSYAKFANLRAPHIEPGMAITVEPEPAVVIPPPPPAPPQDLAERYALVLKRLGEADYSFNQEYQHNFLMSWIFHDGALEGVVYTYEELKTAINPNITIVPESSLQSVCEEIRRHKTAVELVQELGEKKRVPLVIDVLKKIFLTLHPEEGDLKTVKYRRDVPQHRLYFHEYAAPDKIAYKVRQVFDWLNGPEPKKLKNPLRVAARVHYDLLNVFPFAVDSGKVVRLLMNVLLLRSDYPPAIIHSAERQRYYEALRGSPTALFNMLRESVVNALQSIEKKLDESDQHKRPFLLN